MGMPERSNMATTVEESAITEPTDKSNPPEANRIAIPITMIAFGAMPTITARKFGKLKKYGLIFDITMMIAVINTINVNSRMSMNA
jgi:hypothetical protein